MGDAGEVGVDALEVAEQIEVNGAGLDALPQALMQALDMGFDEILSDLGDPDLMAPKLAR